MVFETLGQFMSKLMCFYGYVNDYNGFPKPLKKQEEDAYLEAMANGDKSAREQLINHNMRLVAHVSKKYQGAAEVEELISVGSIGLIKAVDSFKADKGCTLSTYASRCIENEILMLLRSSKKHKQCMSIEETICMDKDGGELAIEDVIPQNSEDDPDAVVERKVFIEQIKDIMQEKLDPREFKIIALRYGIFDHKERTQIEVSHIMNLSRSYVSRIETKALSILRDSIGKDAEWQ